RLGGRFRRSRGGFLFGRGRGFRLGRGRSGLARFLLFRRSACLGQIRGGLAVSQNGRDRSVHRHVGGAFGDQYLAKRALVGGFDFHRRLVGFDLGDDVARLDRLAFLFQPFRKVPLLHGRRKRGHQHLDWHGGSRTTHSWGCNARRRSAIDVGI